MNTEKEIIINASEKANKRELDLKEAEEIVSKYPQSHRAHTLLAFVHFQASDFEKGLEQIKKSLKYGKSVTAYNLSAQANAKLKNFDQVKDDYLNALDLDANDIMTMINYCAFLGEIGSFSECIKNTKRLTLLRPNDLSLKIKLAMMYNTTSAFEDLVNYLEVVVKEFPHEYLFQHMLGNAYFQCDRKEEGVKCYNEAIRMYPESAKSYFNLSHYYYQKEDYSKTIKLLKKSMELTPEWIAPYTQMCFVFYKQNDFSALKEFIFKNESRLNKSVEIAALTELVAVQEGEKSIHSFCPDPMKYITEFHIKDYINDHEKFIEKLKEEIDRYEFFDGYARGSGKSQINGVQTAGNIFVRRGKAIDELRKFFLNAIEDFKKKNNSSHDLIIESFPKKYDLWGWSTKFDKGSGHHFSHLHPSGWVSGAFYLNIPTDIKSHEANIQFDLQGEFPLFNKKVKLEKKNIIPETGKLLIFPSSLFHSTTPFSSKDSYRHALNFDLISSDVFGKDTKDLTKYVTM